MPTDAFIQAVDHLTTLYALDKLGKTDRQTIAALVQNNAKGMAFVHSYLIGSRKDEMLKAASSPNAKLNHFRGHIETVPQDGTSLVIQKDGGGNFERLSAQSYLVSAVATTHCLCPFGCDLLPLRCKVTRQPAILALRGPRRGCCVVRCCCRWQRTRKPVSHPDWAASASLAAFQVHGSNFSSSCRLVRPDTMRSSTSVSQANGSTPFNFADCTSVAMIAQ